MHRTTYWALGAAIFGLSACSDGATRSVGTQAESPAKGVVAATASADTDTVSGLRDPAKALAIQANPFDGCVVTAEGTVAGPAHTEFVTADKDGLVRFYAPPAAWGSKLRFSCSARGGTTIDQHVDLNDESTFARKSAVIEGSGVIGTRPPLTQEQLTTMTPQQLIAAGYPIRPDAAKDPVQYAKWLKIVTKRYDVIATVGVSALGSHAGTYQGTFNDNPDFGFSPPWTGVVQDQAGFTNNNVPSGYTEPLALGSQNYALYLVTMNYVNTQCPENACLTSFWGGIGGYPTNALNQIQTAPLIQSGIQITGVVDDNGQHSSGGQLFVEYVNVNDLGGELNPALPQGKNLAVGDEILAEGWSTSSAGCGGFDNTGEFGCFVFWDTTQGWTTTTQIVGAPPGTPFVGATAEFVTEANEPPTAYPNYNASYYVQAMQGFAFNASGAEFTVQGGDPYIMVNQLQGQGQFFDDTDQLNVVTFRVPFGQQFPDNDPQSTIYFEFVNAK